MTKRVQNHGLSACKSPDGISVRTTDWGAEVCVSRHADTLTLTIHHDGDDTPATVEIPLTSNPYIFDPRTQSATFVAPRSLDAALNAYVTDVLRRNPGFLEKLDEILSKVDRMNDYWGERCPDFEPGCACCEAWKQFDATGNVPT